MSSIATCVSDAIIQSSAWISPQATELEDLARGRVGAGQIGSTGAGLIPQPERERRARAVDEVVHDARDDDLAPERMPVQLLPKRSRSCVGK